MPDNGCHRQCKREYRLFQDLEILIERHQSNHTCKVFEDGGHCIPAIPNAWLTMVDMGIQSNP